MEKEEFLKYKERLVEELIETTIKIERLNNFINNTEKNKVSEDYLKLLNNQFQIMQEYKNILAERVIKEIYNIN